ncbi:MAG: mycothiol system anti-sigma-R factor [Corynebacterium sp.]|uniref:mycothiol system anti-sigma-R factor n=1 Tax=Corynebacterium TaxID=1716 RepID=UPI002648C53C|nr:mycothiol system anti-sigma-R factor [Corynebacterium sp.]MDN5721829.1 mycothiol system anti-sigma-R factor [Corynebacterium sp.]MDN6282628.1 mycothiol system anti-sigma-R factor [Corynebacterium sp.]MDN6306540.1 mycothiol system anti-sigma-R factor [Corynebacterium sp.]MDN6353384.1 mycothiol system anti-sigma-R factor [Corynebacterium sp.]MDN6367550.1 mycothiol system anti-sigma-R factor [Corynebacterium sp.]
MTENTSGTPEHSKCEELVEVLYEYIDVKSGDCEGAEYRQARANLESHVEECPSCLEALGIEQQVRQLLRARCGESAPAELRGRIVTALHASDGSTSVTSVRSTTVRYTEG